MVFFVTFLRALASIIITNSHYTGVYPTDLIANGGLLGDVTFFAVSGFCLLNVKLSFGKWYFKRISRCYISPIIITAIYMILRFYPTPDSLQGFFTAFIFPTKYHFIASIVILYIPFYFVAKIKKLRDNIPIIMGIVFLVYLIIYIFAYDKSYYHIDKVREPMIRFLFFEAMLLGAHFKLNLEKYRDKRHIADWILLLLFAVLYIGSKLVFSRYEAISNLQIINQIILLILLYFTFKCFSGIDSALLKLPSRVKSGIELLSKITLEIYIVQNPIITLLKGVAPFPVNWVLLTVTIFVTAFALNWIAEKISRPLFKLFDK